MTETFAARWHRRKLEAKLEARSVAPSPVAVPVGAETAGMTPTADARDDADADLPLPSLDDITPEGDITAFLGKRIPAELTKLALRKAWSSDPVIAGFIEVAENQYDFNAIDGVPGFGPLNPAWNVEELLAHALGATPAAPEAATLVADIACDKTAHLGVVEADDQTAVVVVAAQHEPTADDQDRVRQGQAASTERLMGGDIRAESDPIAGDMLEQTQRLATHHSSPITQRRHGRALPQT